jgi:hypothetical protein
MAVGNIITCDECGKSWDDGKTDFHSCNSNDVVAKRERERWASMTLEEKCDWLRGEIARVEREIPYTGGY